MFGYRFMYLIYIYINFKVSDLIFIHSNLTLIKILHTHYLLIRVNV